MSASYVCTTMTSHQEGYFMKYSVLGSYISGSYSGDKEELLELTSGTRVSESMGTTTFRFCTSAVGFASWASVPNNGMTVMC